MEPYLPNYLKGKNRRLVFDLLRERGQMSRAEITRDTGMSFPTAMKVVDALLEKGLRVELDDRSEKIGYKIREAQLEKIPYMLVLGEKEQQNGQASVRSRKSGELGAVTVDQFLSDALKEVAEKTL